jgi:hypothetical protein
MKETTQAKITASVALAKAMAQKALAPNPKPAMDGVRNAVNRRVHRTSGRETGSSRSHPPPGRARAEGEEMRRGFVEILAQTVKRPLSENELGAALNLAF